MPCVKLLKILHQHCSSQPKRGCAVVHAATWCRQQGPRPILTKKKCLVAHEQQRTGVSANAARAEEKVVAPRDHILLSATAICDPWKL